MKNEFAIITKSPDADVAFFIEELASACNVLSQTDDGSYIPEFDIPWINLLCNKVNYALTSDDCVAAISRWCDANGRG